MAGYLTRDRIETVALNTPIPFLDSTPCTKRLVLHQNGSGVFILRAPNNVCYARYEVEFTGNIAIPEEGEVTPIATAIVVSGEQMLGSRSIFTPADVEEYGSVTSRAIVDVPSCCCLELSVEYVNGTVDDPTVVPTPLINVIDGSLTITRIA